MNRVMGWLLIIAIFVAASAAFNALVGWYLW